MRKVACLLHGSMLHVCYMDECCFVVAVCCMLLLEELREGAASVKFQKMRFEPSLLRVVCRDDPARTGAL